MHLSAQVLMGSFGNYMRSSFNLYAQDVFFIKHDLANKRIKAVAELEFEAT